MLSYLSMFWGIFVFGSQELQRFEFSFVFCRKRMNIRPVDWLCDAVIFGISGNTASYLISFFFFGGGDQYHSFRKCSCFLWRDFDFNTKRCSSRHWVVSSPVRNIIVFPLKLHIIGSALMFWTFLWWSKMLIHTWCIITLFATLSHLCDLNTMF